MKPTYHLYGMKITLDGDLDEAAKRAHLAQKLMFQTKMLNTNNLDIIQNNQRLDDGTEVYVLSQHGLDSATIYVPPKPTVQVTKPEEQTDLFIWPAFEVYSEEWGGGDYLGIVVCRGGGFEPPYEFISKDTFPKEELPYDKPDEPAGELKDWRFWYEHNKTWEDLEPIGRANGVLCWENGLSYDSGTSWGSVSIKSNSCMYELGEISQWSWCADEGFTQPFVYEKYAAKAAGFQSFTSWASRNDRQVISYRFEDDPWWERWDSYTYYPYTGGSYTYSPRWKPSSRIINSPHNWLHNENGSGFGTVGVGQETATGTNAESIALADIIGNPFYWWVPCYYIGDTTEADIKALALARLGTPNGWVDSDRPRRDNYTEDMESVTGGYLSPYTNYESSIYDDDTFTYLTQERHSSHTVRNTYSYNDPVIHNHCGDDGEPTSSSEEDSTNERGNAVFVLNQDSFVVDVGISNMDNGYVDSQNIKLFKTGDRYDAMSEIWVEDYNPDGNNFNAFRMGYCHIMKRGSDEAVLTVTFIEGETDGWSAIQKPIPDFTSPDGTELYPYGFRLVRETVTYEENL